MIDPLEARLESLRTAAAAARSIGLRAEAERAEAVATRVGERAGFGGEAYVMALAGGTGVGKSSLLNALAGHTVSAVRAVRPTTDEPLAWVAASRREEVAALLAWLGVRHVVEHADPDLSAVVILDLPDVDSVRTEHRSRVDELLPRIDAVTWVADPEKYDDARFHAYIGSMAGHADRMRFVVNKADRLTDAQRAAIADDLATRLAAAGIPSPSIHVLSATQGDGLDRWKAELASASEAKAVLAAKRAADVREALGALADAVGVPRNGSAAPLLEPARLERGIEEATRGALAMVDPPGVARQVQGAVMARARHSGGSLLGRAVGLLGWLTGQQRRRADPATYLLDWRRRGTLGRVLNPVRAALVEAAGAVPPGARPAVLDALGADAVEAAVTHVLDAATTDAAADLRIPRSPLWPVVGVLQLAIGAVFVLAIAWYVTLFVAGGQIPVATVEVAVLGPLPLPLAMLAGSVVASALLGWLVGLHAGIVGRRLAGRVTQRVDEGVRRAVIDVGFGGLASVEAARQAIGGAVAGASPQRDT